MNYNRSNLGSLIKMRREELGIKQAELGEKCNMSRSSMNAIENGRSAPPLDKIITLTNVLKMNFIDNEVILREEDGVSRRDYNTVKNAGTGNYIKELVDSFNKTKDLKNSAISIKDGKLLIAIDINEIITNNGE